MLLREHLEEYKKDQLLQEARSFEISKCSGLRKAELIERIMEVFCSEDMLRNRLACLTQEQMMLFRRACGTPQDISINEVVDSMQMCLYWLGTFEEETDRFCVFEEVADAFKCIDDEAFRSDQYKKGWMMKCVHFFINYYGIAPVEVIYQLYKLKVRDSIDDMIKMLWEMPVDIVESCILSMEMMGLQEWPKTDPLYSERGLLIHLPILESKEMGSLLDAQMDKSFYIPSVQQIEEMCRSGYEESSLVYGKLQSFLRKKLGLSYEQAVTWCARVWANSYEGESPADVIRDMTEAEVAFSSEKQINEFLQLLMDAHNNTRLKENRGHKPCELMHKGLAGGMPTIVPASSQAAELLREAGPQLSEMGIPYDIEGDSDVMETLLYPNGMTGKTVKVEKRIYPNDPCPCGSGKKYKKCCGRK